MQTQIRQLHLESAPDHTAPSNQGHWLSLVMSMMVSFCAVLFPTRCLGWDLELNWVSFWGFFFLLYAIFYSTFSINLATLLAISDTTADQTIHLIRVCTISYFAILKKHKRKYGWRFDPKHWAEILEHTLCFQIIPLHLIRIYAIFSYAFSINLAIFY